jgi:hypothetical protein
VRESKDTIGKSSTRQLGVTETSVLYPFYENNCCGSITEYFADVLFLNLDAFLSFGRVFFSFSQRMLCHMCISD